MRPCAAIARYSGVRVQSACAPSPSENNVAFLADHFFREFRPHATAQGRPHRRETDRAPMTTACPVAIAEEIPERNEHLSLGFRIHGACGHSVVIAQLSKGGEPLRCACVDAMPWEGRAVLKW